MYCTAGPDYRAPPYWMIPTANCALQSLKRIKTNNYKQYQSRIEINIGCRCIVMYSGPFQAVFGSLKRHYISDSIPFVFVFMVQSVDNMALARLGKCCRSLVRESSKSVFCRVVWPSWNEGCVGGKTKKTRQRFSCLIHACPLKLAALQTEKLT